MPDRETVSLLYPLAIGNLLTACMNLAAGIGAPVELWGKEIKIDDVASVCGTVGYELMCAVTQRVQFAIDRAEFSAPSQLKSLEET